MPKIITRTREQAFELWIAALLSKKYMQAKEALRDTLYEDGNEVGVGFCCVGVLCDLANKDRKEEWERGDFTYTFIMEDGHQFTAHESSEMPEPMREFMGISMAEASKLYEMNDQKNKSFEQIAVHIRDKLMPKALKRAMPFKG